MQTGSQQVGRPSIGSWMSYGLGSSNQNLPSFIVMLSRGKNSAQNLNMMISLERERKVDRLFDFLGKRNNLSK